MLKPMRYTWCHLNINVVHFHRSTIERSVEHYTITLIFSVWMLLQAHNNKWLMYNTIISQETQLLSLDLLKRLLSFISIHSRIINSINHGQYYIQRYPDIEEKMYKCTITFIAIHAIIYLQYFWLEDDSKKCVHNVMFK